VSIDGPSGRVTVAHRTQVELNVRVIRHTPEETRTLREETLEGTAGERLALGAETVLGGQAVRLALGFRAEEDQDDGTLPLTIRSRVLDPSSGRPLGRLERRLSMPDGRLRLVELWSAGAGGERLVLAVSASWEEVPRVVPVQPDAHPVDLVVEVLREGPSGSRELVERHRLSTLVGSPVSYAFVRRPRRAADAAEDEAPAPGRMTIEILPDAMSGGEVGLSIAIRHEGRDIYSEVASLDLRVRHEVGPGFSVDVPLPEAGDAGGLVFRVTPYF
jgi:hypothetical protein